MAFARKSSFSVAEQNISLLCAAVSHPARLRIMSRISAAKRDGVAFAELCSGIDLHYSTISQHLKYLRDMKLITSKQRGVTTVHMVHPHMTEAVRLLHCMIAAAGEEPSIITSETNLKALSRVDHLVDDNPATEVQG